jgi:hypothetical protein
MCGSTFELKALSKGRERSFQALVVVEFNHMAEEVTIQSGRDHPVIKGGESGWRGLRFLFMCLGCHRSRLLLHIFAVMVSMRGDISCRRKEYANELAMHRSMSKYSLYLIAASRPHLKVTISRSH